LWQRLRNRQVGGVKFRRQHVLNRFILDFASLRPRLCIEVDGPIHQYSQEHDAVRQEVIEAMGFRVIRFTNGEVIEDVDAVVNQILDALGPRSPK
jgi:very-short-patch-repair endonuclease